MPKSITIDHTDATTVTIAPAGAVGGYRINIKYALEELNNTELYRKEVTYYNAASGLLPVLPASFETNTDAYIAFLEGGLNTLEGL